MPDGHRDSGAHGKDETEEHPAAKDHRGHLSKDLSNKAKGHGSPSMWLQVGDGSRPPS